MGHRPGPDDGSDENPPADEIPSGSGKDAVQQTGIKPEDTDYKDNPDYDSDQDFTEDSDSQKMNQNKSKSTITPSKGPKPASRASSRKFPTGTKKKKKLSQLSSLPVAALFWFGTFDGVFLAANEECFGGGSEATLLFNKRAASFGDVFELEVSIPAIAGAFAGAFAGDFTKT